MAFNQEELNQLIASFNQKYGVNFDLNNYMHEVETTDGLITSDTYNAYYKSMLESLVKDYLDVKINLGLSIDANAPTLTTMVDDFENVMSSCREYREENNFIWNQPFGGLSPQERADMLDGLFNGNEVKPIDISKENYLEGNIRIRDMVAQARTLTGRSSEADMTKVASYALALESINATRGFVWKLFHPFRNNAERRDARVIRDIIAEVSPEKANQVFDKAQESLDFYDKEKMAIANFKTQIPTLTKKENLEKAQREKARNELKAENNNKKKIAKEEKAQITKAQKMQAIKSFLEIGYQPTVETYENDRKNINILVRAQQKGLITDSKTKEILKVNFNRIKSVRDFMASKATDELSLKDAITDAKVKWTEKDNELKTANPDYQPKDLDKIENNFDELEKEPIKVKLNEKKGEAVSEKVEEASKINPLIFNKNN